MQIKPDSMIVAPFYQALLRSFTLCNILTLKNVYKLCHTTTSDNNCNLLVKHQFLWHNSLKIALP